MDMNVCMIVARDPPSISFRGEEGQRMALNRFSESCGVSGKSLFQSLKTKIPVFQKIIFIFEAIPEQPNQKKLINPLAYPLGWVWWDTQCAGLLLG